MVNPQPTQLYRNAEESERMVAAVEEAGVPNMVWYNYRRVPAVTLAKQLIDEGRLGRIFHYRAKFLQDWTISADLPQMRIRRKMETLQAGFRRWQNAGGDPSAIAKTMEEKFKPLLEAGKLIEAEAELDRALEQLKQDAK